MMREPGVLPSCRGLLERGRDGNDRGGTLMKPIATGSSEGWNPSPFEMRIDGCRGRGQPSRWIWGWWARVRAHIHPGPCRPNEAACPDQKFRGLSAQRSGVEGQLVRKRCAFGSFWGSLASCQRLYVPFHISVHAGEPVSQMTGSLPLAGHSLALHGLGRTQLR